MYTFLVIVHILVCITLVLVVLLQAGKGAEIGAAFGSGGSQTLFGSRGAGSFLTKVTAAAAAIFMITSLALAIISTHGTKASVVESTPAKKEAPAMPGGAPPAMPQGQAGQGQPAAPMSKAPAAPAQAPAHAVPVAPVAPQPQGGK